MKKETLTFLSLTLIAALSACGGGGSSDSSTPSGGSASVISGIAADGYLQNALVYLDLNGNRTLDAGEPSTLTTAGGHFSLSAQNAGSAPLVIEVVPGQTVDEDSPSVTAAKAYRLETAPGKYSFVSPLTTLVCMEMAKNPGKTVQDAEMAVRFTLGLGNELTMFDNYVEPALSGDASQHGTDARKIYNAARIVARLMEGLRAELQTNLGGVIAPEEEKIAQYIITDRVMSRKDDIKAAVGQGDQVLNATTIAAEAQEALAKIDTSRLNSGLVDTYGQLIAQNNPVWDAQSPARVQAAPPIDQLAPVNTHVQVVFDEQLDPSSVTSGAMVLVGGGQTIGGHLSYNAATRTLTLAPSQELSSFTSYDVVFAPTLTDLRGNPVESNSGWSFTTIFNQTPPEPPLFS